MSRAASLATLLVATWIGALICTPPNVTPLACAALPSDFNGDAYTDLAVGVPSEDVGHKEQAGAVNVLYGSQFGLTAAGDQHWTQDTPGVLGTAEGGPGHDENPYDRFGAALASGDFDRDGYADLAIGVPEDRVAGVRGLVGVDSRLGRWIGWDRLPRPLRDVSRPTLPEDPS